MQVGTSVAIHRCPEDNTSRKPANGEIDDPSKKAYWYNRSHSLLTSPAFAANDNAASAKQPDNARAQSSDDMKSKEGKAVKKAEKSDETPGEEENASRSADGEW